MRNTFTLLITWMLFFTQLTQAQSYCSDYMNGMFIGNVEYGGSLLYFNCSIGYTQIIFTASSVSSGPSAIALDAVGTDTQAPAVYYSYNSKYLAKRTLDHLDTEIVLITFNPTRYIAGLAIDYTARKLYWTWPDANSVLRSNLDGTSMETILTTAVNPNKIYVDSIGNRMFFTMPSKTYGVQYGQGVGLADLSGANYRTVGSGLLRNPQGICMDATRQKVYVTDSGIDTSSSPSNTEAIQWFSPDSPTPTLTTAVSGNMVMPTDVACSQYEDRLWWVDTMKDYIETWSNIDQSRSVWLNLVPATSTSCYSIAVHYKSAAPSPSPSPSMIPSASPTPSRTPSSSSTPSTSPSRSPTSSPSAAASPSSTPSVTPTSSVTPSRTPSPTSSPSMSPSSSPSSSPSMSSSPSTSSQPSASSSSTATPSSTPSTSSEPSQSVTPSTTSNSTAISTAADKNLFSGNNIYYAAAGGGTFLLLLASGIILAFYCKRRRSNPERNPEQPNNTELAEMRSRANSISPEPEKRFSVYSPVAPPSLSLSLKSSLSLDEPVATSRDRQESIDPTTGKRFGYGIARGVSARNLQESPVESFGSKLSSRKNTDDTVYDCLPTPEGPDSGSGPQPRRKMSFGKRNSPPKGSVAVAVEQAPDHPINRTYSDYSELQLNEKIGQGAFGEVYKAKWRNQEVAVKRLTQSTVQKGESSEQEFLAEAEIMAKMRPHDNVAGLLGVSLKPLAIVVKFYKNGSLHTYLKNMYPRKLNIRVVMKILKGIAAGMSHLHEEEIIHRDLAARNVLLTSNMDPAISDFGFSRILEKEWTAGKTTANFGPIRHMPPESLTERLYSTKSDVWAFGVTAWEVIACDDPYNGVDDVNVVLQVLSGKRLEIPETCPPRLASLVASCWAKEPDDRPDFQFIFNELEQIEAEET